MTLGQDLRYAVRLLVKDRWFTAVAPQRWPSASA